MTTRVVAWLLLASLCCPAAFAELLQGDGVAVEYAPRDEAVARDTLSTIEDSIEEFSNHLPSGSDPIHVVICSTPEEFARYAGPYSEFGAIGVTKSGSGTIAVRPPRLQRLEVDYRGLLRHELIHILLERNTDPLNMPRWFEEGICMVVSGERRLSNSLQMAQMYLRNQVIEYPALDYAFFAPRSPDEFGDAYIQSYSMTKYLMKRLGEKRFWELVAALGNTSFADALKEKAGLDPAGLWAAWRRSLWKIAIVSSLVSGFGVFQFMAILCIVAYLRKRQRKRRIERQWAEEDGEFLTVWDLEGTEPPLPWEEDDG